MTSREVDELVAVKVMGWYRTEPKICTDEYLGEIAGGGCYCSCGWTGNWGESDGHLDERNSESPNYSTDISAAWEVVGYLGKTHIWYFKTRGVMTEVDLSEFGDDSADKAWFNVSAMTAPMAICLAALKSVGVEVDQTL